MDAPTLPAGHENAPVVVAFSGGLDSSVLLHLLAGSTALRRNGLRALHVHHGLHAEADAWAAHCEATCASLGIGLRVVAVQVERDRGLGPEAAARAARHAAFATELGEAEVIALAHHQDDQAETFLLRALRASGPEGLAAMRPWRPFARGWLWRPLLDQPRAALRAHARTHALRWIEDPSNRETEPDRNFLRLRVLPVLRDRWPQADAAFARAAALQAEAAALLEDGDDGALASARTIDPQVLRADTLRGLPVARRARVLRRWIAALDLPPLPARGVERIESDLLGADANSGARFAWAGAEVERWRDLLHAGARRAELPGDWFAEWSLDAPLALPTGDVLSIERGDIASDPDGAASIVPAPALPLRVHARRGGERIVLPARAHSHALKHLLQDLGVPPWERARLPLLSDAEGRLLAAGDLAYSAGFDAWLREQGARLHWTRSM